jgi:MFS-type transporter involved in bile tolerance (Atg22 family)
MLWMAVATILIALVGIVLSVRADAKAEPDVADWDR